MCYTEHVCKMYDKIIKAEKGGNGSSYTMYEVIYILR
jgi:hypothetical protein